MTIEQELESIRLKNGGVLCPSDVVKFARKTSTSLHDKFEWDESAAAEKYRIFQARNIIRVVVQVIEQSSEPIRVYVSMREDRDSGGGYRAMVDVLKSEDLLERMLVEALAELQVFRKKYAVLKKLKPVFDSIDGVKSGS